MRHLSFQVSFSDQVQARTWTVLLGGQFIEVWNFDNHQELVHRPGTQLDQGNPNWKERYQLHSEKDGEQQQSRKQASVSPPKPRLEGFSVETA